MIKLLNKQRHELVLNEKLSRDFNFDINLYFSTARRHLGGDHMRRDGDKMRGGYGRAVR